MTATPGALSVLVVDELPANRVVAATQLRAFGHRCAEAPGGEEALRLLAPGGFDAVVMGLRMPSLDGLEATRRLRALPGRAADVGVVGVTAYVRTGQAAEALAAGMDALLTRPVPAEELEAELRKAVARRAPVPALDPARRAARQAAAPPGEVAADRDQEALATVAALLVPLRGAPEEQVREAAAAVLAAATEIGAEAVAAAARALGERPEAARFLLPPLVSAIMTARTALREEARRMASGPAVPI